MLNVGGSRSAKRMMLYGAVKSIVPHGARVWCRTLEKRKSFLRVASSFRTTSTAVLQVITGMIPIDLLAHERKFTIAYRN